MRWLRLILLFAPVVAHFAVLIVHAWRRGPLEIDAAGMIVTAAVAAYGVGAAICAARPEKAPRFLLSTYTTLVSIALLEGVLRLIVPPMPSSVPWPPMRRVSVAGDLMPGVEPGSRCTFTVNRFGVRGPAVDIRKADVRVLCVGGSVTECLYITDEKSWPWLLAGELGKRTGKDVFVGNAGRAGHQTMHHTYLLRNYEYRKDFEWVVCLTGINDMGSFATATYNERLGRLAEDTLTPSLRRRPYFRRMVLAHLIEGALAPVRARAGDVVQHADGQWMAYARGVRRDAVKSPEIPHGLDAALARYREDLRSLVQACRTNGQRLLLLTQPTLYRKDLPPELEALLFQGLGKSAIATDRLAELMTAYNRVLLEVARDEGVDAIDLDAVIPKDTSAMYDDCHFNWAGCEKVARAVAEVLAPKIAATPAAPPR